MTAAEILRARRKVEEAARKAAKAARQLGTVAVQAPTGSESLTSTQTATLSVAVQTLPRVVVFFDLAQGTPDEILARAGVAGDLRLYRQPSPDAASYTLERGGGLADASRIVMVLNGTRGVRTAQVLESESQAQMIGTPAPSTSGGDGLNADQTAMLDLSTSAPAEPVQSPSAQVIEALTPEQVANLDLNDPGVSIVGDPEGEDPVVVVISDPPRHTIPSETDVPPMRVIESQDGGVVAIGDQKIETKPATSGFPWWLLVAAGVVYWKVRTA